MTLRRNRKSALLVAGIGGIFGMWAVAMLIGGLYRVDWHVTELVRQYLVASGMIRPIHTVVDFYTHIKGIEYIICVLFFVVFSVFFKYVEKRDKRVKIERRVNIDL
jgi:hypothetical protein